MRLTRARGKSSQRERNALFDDFWYFWSRKSTIKEKFLYVSSRVVEGADPYKIKPKSRQQPKEKSNLHSLFLLQNQAQKKKLSKRKRRKEISHSAERDKGDLPLTQPPFEKGGRKLYYSKKIIESKEYNNKEEQKMRAYERFLKYVAFPTMSDPESESVPSTKKQLALAEALAAELREMGLVGVEISEYGYVYASLPANYDKELPTIGFISHMDTSSEAADEPIRSRIVKYTGGDILLNEEKGIYMRTSDYPYLADYAGDELIVTDGTTLLGADDKAGIAEIMTALEKLISENIPHGEIKIAFTPDEEIGRGADHFDVARFGADYAYTVDGGALGELEYENFNAAGALVTIHGVSIHPGSAKDRMKNAILIAGEYNSMLPENEIPAKTEGYEGFFHLYHIEGETENTTMKYIIRDHDAESFARRKELMKAAGEAINRIYGEGTAEVKITDSYRNMREMIEPRMYIVDRAKKAMADCGVSAKIVPIRGGTDGARLSFMGLPCPNLCTGGENFHSRFEFVSVSAMDKISDIIAKIAENLTRD